MQEIGKLSVIAGCRNAAMQLCSPRPAHTSTKPLQMSKKKTFAVRGPDGTPHTVGFETNPKHQTAWSKLLAGWHATDQTVYCLCRTANPVQLVIRKYDSGKLSLARHPNTGPQHDSDCRYFGPSIAGAIASAYLPGAVVDTDGVYKVQLSVGRRMQNSRGNAPPVEGRPPPSTGSRRRGTLTPLGLLALLWEIAALNQYRPSWAPTRAKPASVSGLLLNAAKGVR